MTQDEFNKAPKLDQILYDCTGMLVKNHPDIEEAMQKYADQQLIIQRLSNQRELLLAVICEYNKINTQKEIIEVEKWIEKWHCK